MASDSFAFDNKELRANIKAVSDKVDSYIHGVFDYASDLTVAYAKTNAPWRDRTGAARAGLRTEAFWVPQKSHTLVLFHSVLYGIWLEVRFAGKYAIINPTIQVMGPKVMSLLQGLFRRLGTGGVR